jgi:hypothetical protein
MAYELAKRTNDTHIPKPWVNRAIHPLMTVQGRIFPMVPKKLIGEICLTTNWRSNTRLSAYVKIIAQAAPMAP